MGDRQTWRGRAACAGLGLEFDSPEADFFFILPGQKSKRAKDFCVSCPVKRECLEFALIYGEYGIWGGTTDKEREDFPRYIVEAMIKRERETVGMESRNVDDFIPRNHQSRLSQAVHQETIQRARFVQAEFAQTRGRHLELVAQLEEQVVALDHLFEQSNVLLESFL